MSPSAVEAPQSDLDPAFDVPARELPAEPNDHEANSHQEWRAEPVLGGGQVHRSGLVMASSLAAVTLIGSGQPLALAPLGLALSLSVAAAAAGPGPRRSVVGLLPLGFLVTFAWVMVWGLAWGALRAEAWGSRPSAAAGVVALLGIAGLVARRRGDRVEVWGTDGTALAGLLLLLGLGAFVVVTQPLEVWSRVMGSGTDFARHLFHVREVMETGGMPFGVVGYPRGLHAPVAMLASALGLDPTMDVLWRAVAPLIWLMLALVLVAVMATAGRLAGRLAPVQLAGPTASVVAGLAFVQMAWFDTFLAFGSIMNILVGVVLTTLLVVGLQPRVFGSTLGSLTAATTLAVTANAWQLLLPLVGIGALPWIVQWARRGWRRIPDAAVWLTGLLVALNGMADQRTRDVGNLVSGATVSDLFRPEWWWWAAMGVAGVALFVAFRTGLRTWALSVGGLVAASIVTVAGLIRATGSSWDLMLYYPVKALWTAIIVIVPLAAAGLAWLAVHTWRRAGGWNPGAAALGRGLIALVIGVLVVGVIGRGAAFPPHLQKIAEGRTGYPNWPMAVVDALADVDLSGRSQAGAVAFGIVPSAPVGAVQSGFVGMVDYMTMESLRFAGIDGDTFSTPFKAALRDRDMTGVCYYLREHPGSIRITGPNPAAGPQWIVDSGCPVDVVDPESWIVLDLDPEWHRGTPWEVGFGPFPDFAAVHDAAR